MPYAVAFYIFNRFSTEWRHNSKSFRAQAVLFEVYISAIITALLSRRHLPHYFVTKKVAEIPMLIERLNHVLPHITIITISFAGIIYGFFHSSENQGFYYINAAWALWVVWILLPFTVLALREPAGKK